MTKTVGAHIVQAPCCGRVYQAPNYASINFSAREHWTDGWRGFTLMPNDEGLRRCQCGQYHVMTSLTPVSTVDQSDLDRIERVDPEELPHCIANATNEDVEIAARLEYWRHLNHPYREQYRKHRDAEDARTQAQWEAALAKTQSWWDRVRGKRPVEYVRPSDASFTYPPFHPTSAQSENMQRLSDILRARTIMHQGNYSWVLAELYREMGPKHHDSAEEMILCCNRESAESPALYKMMRDLIESGESAPMRYRA